MAELSALAFAAGAGLLGGAMNALAGGGTFATMPTLIALGLPSPIANATSRPSATTEARIAGSTKGTGTCTMPSAPPASITPTKASGQAQTALPPFIAAQRPTAIITVM